MSHFVLRTCTEIGEDDSPSEAAGPSDESIDWFKLLNEDDSPAASDRSSRHLEDFRESDAYVLLGAPGAGKTVAFKQEAERDGCHYVTARDFITFDDRPEWRGVTLFIDGLDEMRAGAADGRTPLDAIRAKLDRIERPRFRLSCREADWFGANDRAHLKSVSIGGEVKVLRLDSLSEDSIRELLVHRTDIEDTDRFTATARERGIDGLLANPQSLLMLAQAVAGGSSWPETRKETFELACKRLVHEHNTGHQSANRRLDIPESELLDAAGRLCAVQLLTGSAGYVLLDDEEDSEYLGLQRISGGNQAALRHVLGTRLFESPGENREAPTHRQIAEFLAGRYLSQRLEGGLPVGRVLALMTGDDGGIVSELRGLSAWLAAHSKTSRGEIIDRDPFGVVLYGDIGEFSCEEKRRVLVCLDREAKRNPWFVNTLGIDSRLGSLATPDMEEVFRSFLTDPARNEARQWITFMLMQSLMRGRRIPQLDELLMGIVRDEEWWPETRLLALDAFIQHRKSGAGDLKMLLTDVYSGSVSDPGDDLLGSLLSALYPENLSASDVLEYLRPHRDSSGEERYLEFWSRHLPEKSTSAQLVDLLEAITERFSDPDPASWEPPLSPERLVLRLLVGFIETTRESVSPDRLFRWLMIARDGILHSLNETNCIHDWLISQPELRKGILAASVAYCSGSSDFSQCMIRHTCWIEHVIGIPQGWYLDQAMSAIGHDAAEYFIREVAYIIHRHQRDGDPIHQDLSREIVEERLADHADLLHMFTESLVAVETKHMEMKKESMKISERNAFLKKMSQNAPRDDVKPHETALKENRGNPELLDRLARYYFHNMQAEDSGERLHEFFGRDDELIEAILTGLRGSVSRSDVPGVAEILRLRKKNITHHMVLPFLAGLEELVRTAPIERVFSDAERIRRALAFHYTVPIPRHPSWYNEVLDSHAELAAETLVQSIRAEISAAAKSSHPSLFGVFRLRDCEKIARLASIPLLDAFPIRWSSLQLRALGSLVRNALEYCDAAHLLKVVDRKLAHRSLSVGQRVCWLAAGLLASENTDSADLYREGLKKCVSGRERRVQYLEKFLDSVENRSPSEVIRFQNISTLQLLVRLLGVSYKPVSSNAIVYKYSFGRSLTARFIDSLASASSPDATKSLEELMDAEALQAWRPYLVNAKYRQNIVRREAGFRHSDVEQVLKTLDHGKPANAADLAALTFDVLTEIARTIRDGNTSDWRQYWNWDGNSHRQPSKPMHEDHCRDRLLSDLRSRVEPLGIDAAPEGRYADEKRSDIRVSYGGFNVPVEIKKSKHRNLWSAIRNQLIAKYTRDPGADGHGIYVVFWFGREHCQPPESGPRPSNAAELEERLCDTLSPEEARKIRICVIDVAEPQA